MTLFDVFFIVCCILFLYVIITRKKVSTQTQTIISQSKSTQGSNKPQKTNDNMYMSHTYLKPNSVHSKVSENELNEFDLVLDALYNNLDSKGFIASEYHISNYTGINVDNVKNIINRLKKNKVISDNGKIISANQIYRRK